MTRKSVSRRSSRSRAISRRSILIELAKKCKKRGMMLNTKSGKCISITKKSKRSSKRVSRRRSKRVSRRRSKRVSRRVSRREILVELAKKCKKRGMMLNTKSGKCISIVKKSKRSSRRRSRRSSKRSSRRRSRRSSKRASRRRSRRSASRRSASRREILVELAKKCKKRGMMLNTKSGKCISIVKRSSRRRSKRASRRH
jgi:hypothetical protein